MILDEGKIDKTSDFTITDHCALIEKMESSEIFKAELSAEQLSNLATYFVSLPSEATMKLWTALGTGEIKNVTGFHQARGADGTGVAEKLVKVLGAGE